MPCNLCFPTCHIPPKINFTDIILVHELSEYHRGKWFWKIVTYFNYYYCTITLHLLSLLLPTHLPLTTGGGGGGGGDQTVVSMKVKFVEYYFSSCKYVEYYFSS